MRWTLFPRPNRARSARPRGWRLFTAASAAAAALIVPVPGLQLPQGRGCGGGGGGSRPFLVAARKKGKGGVARKMHLRGVPLRLTTACHHHTTSAPFAYSSGGGIHYLQGAAAAQSSSPRAEMEARRSVATAGSHEGSIGAVTEARRVFGHRSVPGSVERVASNRRRRVGSTGERISTRTSSHGGHDRRSIQSDPPALRAVARTPRVSTVGRPIVQKSAAAARESLPAVAPAQCAKESLGLLILSWRDVQVPDQHGLYDTWSHARSRPRALPGRTISLRYDCVGLR